MSNNDEIVKMNLMIEQINNAISELLSGKVKSYKIGSRSFEYYDIQELLNIRDRLIQETNGIKSKSFFPRG